MTEPGLSNRATSRIHQRDGSALLIVLGLLLTLGLIVAGTMMIARHAERLYYARGLVSDTETLAVSAVETLTERLIAHTGSRLGRFEMTDLNSLNAAAPSIITGLSGTRAALSDQPDSLGYRIVDIRDYEAIPHDEKVLAAWTHQPRERYAAIPPVGGQIAARTIEIEVFATAFGNRGSQRMATRRIAVSVIAPHQWAVYTAGDGHFLASSSESTIGGPVRIDGAGLFYSGSAFLRYVGGIEARDEIHVWNPSTHIVSGSTFGTAGMPALGSLTRATMQNDPQAAMSVTQGRVRVRPGVAGELAATRFQTTALAGSGECADFTANCGGAGRYLPSLTVQRRTAGIGTGYTVVCGAPYASTCAATASALNAPLTYHPYPWNTAPPAGTAAVAPGGTELWKGLFPDPRREGPCTASVGANTFETLRCPTNAHGFKLDIGALPAVTGGLISVRRAINQTPGANPDRAREVLMIHSAATLTGPLTIHSEIPVFIVGNYNLTAQPSMIIAPRITVLPNEALDPPPAIPALPQLDEASRWDYVPDYGGTSIQVLPLEAQTPVTVYAVLRAGYCGVIGSANYGGTWEGLPAVLGDWRRTSLRVNGAIEGIDQTPGGAALCGIFNRPLGVPTPSGLTTYQPVSRSVLYDRRLLHPGYQPPGSYNAANIPAAGLAGAPTRTQARQANAFGGTTVLRLIQDVRSIPPSDPGTTLRPTGATTTITWPMPLVPPPPAL